MNKLRKLLSGTSNSKTKSQKVVRPSKINHSHVPSHPRNGATVQNIHVIWLDADIDESHDDDCRNSIAALRQIANKVDTFIDVDACIDFISELKQGKVCMISSGALGKTTVPLVHHNPHISTIYIFCSNKARHERWANHWPKVKGVYTDMTSICEALKQSDQDSDQDSGRNLISFGIVDDTDNNLTRDLNELDNSFMYTLILKEILLEIDFTPSHIFDFAEYSREHLTGNNKPLDVVDEFEKTYKDDGPIYWYTKECFLYRMVNNALRHIDIPCIIKTGFFIRDVHNDITECHVQEYGHLRHSSDPFTLYRGQKMSQEEFDRIQKAKGGLLSFNSFLSTSKNEQVSRDFAQSRDPAQLPEDEAKLARIIFVMEIDPSISSTPFADIAKQSAIKKEEETLFSMHSVFRIGNIRKEDDQGGLWKVNLTLIDGNDHQFHALTERIREETKGATGWLRLGKMLVKLAQYKEAECIYKFLSHQLPDENEKANIIYQRGLIKYYQGEYNDAIALFEESLKVRRNIPPSEDPGLAECYNDMGLVYYKMAEYSQALEYYEKALEMRQNAFSRNHPDVAESYNNIASVYGHMNEDSKAISYYTKALRIYQKTLPENHPHVATCYNNLGLEYSKKDDKFTALLHLNNALEIFRKVLLSNHPDLAALYNNIGLVYSKMDEYDNALKYYRKALKIYETPSSTHPHLAAIYTNMGGVYANKNKYTEALECHKKALEIYKKTLSPKHPNLACCYGYIGIVLYQMEKYPEAVASCELAVEIATKSLPPDHPQLQQYIKNLEIVKEES